MDHFVYMVGCAEFRIPVISEEVGLEIEKENNHYVYGKEENFGRESIKSVDDFKDYLKKQEEEQNKKHRLRCFNNFNLYKVNIFNSSLDTLYHSFFIRNSSIPHDFLIISSITNYMLEDTGIEERDCWSKLGKAFYIKSVERVAEPGESHPEEIF